MFADDNNIIKPEYTIDGTHLTELAYNTWTEYEKELITNVIAGHLAIISNDLRVYPNPVIDKLIINGLDNSQKYNFSVYLLTGKLVMRDF